MKESERQMPAYAPESTSSLEGASSQSVDVKLVGEAAYTLTALVEKTGLSPESLLTTSIGLLKVAVRARSVGRRFVVTTKAWWPIKEFVLPRSW